MLIYTQCIQCNDEIKLRTLARTRVELAMSKGEEIESTCKSCNSRNKYPVDKFEAKQSKIGLVIVAAMMTFAYIVLFYLFLELLNANVLVASSIILVPAAAFGIYSKQEANRIRYFNSHQLKRMR